MIFLVKQAFMALSAQLATLANLVVAYYATLFPKTVKIIILAMAKAVNR